jgi:hypothetical protein
MKARKIKMPRSKYSKQLGSSSDVPLHRNSTPAIKYVTFMELKAISDSNYGRFNRSVNMEALWKSIKNKPLEKLYFRLEIAMEHSNFMGGPVETHYRCIVSHSEMNGTAWQEISVVQWQNLPDRGEEPVDNAIIEAIWLLAEQGSPDAQYVVGAMYYEGRGVPKNDAEAVKWWQLSAEQGHKNAQNALGHLYANRRGVPMDDGKAA